MTMPQPRELSLSAADGTPLYVADWPVGSAPGEGIVLMHGIGEESGRYAHVARYFNDCGYSVRAYDHRGHGRSGGPRGDAPDAETLIQDAKLVIDAFARNLSAPPLLLGHSMGGLFAACYATRALSPLGGLILSGPALSIRPSGAQKLLPRGLAASKPCCSWPATIVWSMPPAAPPNSVNWRRGQGRCIPTRATTTNCSTRSKPAAYSTISAPGSANGRARAGGPA